LKKRTPLPAGAILRFNRDPSNARLAGRKTAETALLDWFDCPKPVTLDEDIIGLGKYGCALTVLSSNADLEERWTPRFAYGRWLPTILTGTIHVRVRSNHVLRHFDRRLLLGALRDLDPGCLTSAIFVGKPQAAGPKPAPYRPFGVSTWNLSHRISNCKTPLQICHIPFDFGVKPRIGAIVDRSGMRSRYPKKLASPYAGL
jgi:hypothetical protein